MKYAKRTFLLFLILMFVQFAVTGTTLETHGLLFMKLQFF